MKGDFTRSTFRPQKHYTSVRMQQGRLQLDADWNEQADIQNHLRRTQTVDMIGASSGAASVELATGRRNENGFRVVPITLANLSVDDASTDKSSTDNSTNSSNNIFAHSTDLALIPGHFYANGVLCELEEGSAFEVEVIENAPTLQSNDISTFTVAVSSLTVDGRAFEPGQWLEIAQPRPEERSKITTLEGWRVRSIDAKNRLLTVEGALPALEEAALSTEEKTGKQIFQWRRLVTYSTQPNYPNPPEWDAAGRQLVYVDVWQRHVTAVDDAQMRDKALNVPDTTTRTQTVWQLKLLPLPATLLTQQRDDSQAVSGQETSGQETSEQETSEQETSEQEIRKQIEDFWQKFLAEQRQHAAFLSACAGLCSRGNNGSSPPLRLENQLYRIEIHTPGNLNEDEETVDNDGSGPTFKWSRDNGSLVSEVESLDKVRSLIRIRQSNQDAWGTTQPGQWLELTTEEQELKIEPGILVPFVSAIGNQISFDGARIVGASDLPKNITKIRRWDNKDEQATIPLQNNTWMPLEAGIQIKFGADLNSVAIADEQSSDAPDSDSETEATLNQTTLAAVPSNPDYKTGDYWLIPARSGPQDIEWPNDQASEDPQPIAQPPAGIEHVFGLLAVTNFSEEEQVKDERIVFPPLLQALDRRGGTIEGDLHVEGIFTTNQFDVEGDFAAQTFRGAAFELALNPTAKDPNQPDKYGVIQLDRADKQIQFVAESGDKVESFAFIGGALTVVEGLSVAKQATLAIDAGQTVGIGMAPTAAKLGVAGDVTISETLKVTESIAIGTKTPDPLDQLYVDGRAHVDGTGRFAIQNDSRVEIGAIAPDTVSSTTKLYVKGETLIEGETTLKGETTIEGETAIDGSLTSKTVTATDGDFKSPSSTDLTLKTGDKTGMVIDHDTGNVSIGEAVNSDFILDVQGTVQAETGRFAIQENGRVEIGGILPEDERDTETKLYVDGDVLVTGSITSNNPTVVAAAAAVNSPAGETLTLKTDNETRLSIAPDGYIDIPKANDETRFSIAPNGHIGIGRKIPTVALDVVGDTKISKTLDVGGKTLLATENDSMVCIGAENPPSASEDEAAAPDSKLYVEGNITAREVGARTFAQLSTQTAKREIQSLSSLDATNLLGQLNPVTFIYKEDAAQSTHAGFIAENTPDLLTSKNHQNIKILDITAVVTQSVKHHHELISQLVEVVNKQQTEIATLNQRLADLENKQSDDRDLDIPP